MKKTKIICTMGPNMDTGDTLRDVMLAGMDVARLNFSHEAMKSIKDVWTTSKNCGKNWEFRWLFC